MAERGAARELRGGALDGLAGDGGVGRERVALSPGSVSFGGRGKYCVPAPVLPSDPGCDLTRGIAVELWLPRGRV